METGIVLRGQRKTKFRTTTEPEGVFVNTYLAEVACQEMLDRYAVELREKEDLYVQNNTIRNDPPTSLDHPGDEGVLMLGNE